MIEQTGKCIFVAVIPHPQNEIGPIWIRGVVDGQTAAFIPVMIGSVTTSITPLARESIRFFRQGGGA